MVKKITADDFKKYESIDILVFDTSYVIKFDKQTVNPIINFKYIDITTLNKSRIYRF